MNCQASRVERQSKIVSLTWFVSLINRRNPWRSTWILHVSVGLAVMFGVSCHRSAIQPSNTNSTQRSSIDCGQVTEITLERTFSVCTDCPAYKVVLGQQSRTADSIAVALTDLKTNRTRQGTLNKSTFDQLCRLIDSEHYFELSNAYGEGIVDTGDVTTSVLENGIRKTILNRGEKGPIGLWGIEMAIDGAVASATWQSVTK
jgi:hypothetical protein